MPTKRDKSPCSAAIPAFDQQSRHRTALTAARAAGLGATAAKPRGYLGRCGALSLPRPQAEYADPDRVDLPVHGVPPVTVLVPPLLVCRVRGGAVDLDASPVLVVKVVQVAVAGAVP